jgi:hypothetical protein
MHFVDSATTVDSQTVGPAGPARLGGAAENLGDDRGTLSDSAPG